MAFKTETVSVRDGVFRVEVRCGGRGEPLVFLHGSGGQAGWPPFLDALAERYMVYLPIHPGWGASEGLEHIDDIIDFAIFYYDLFDALGIENPHVIGHSLGGMLAAEVAALDPSSVRKLVLANPAGLWLDEAPPLDFFAVGNDELMRAVLYDPSTAAEVFGRPDPDDREAMARALFERTKAFAAAGKFLWPIWDKGLRKRLHRIKAPTLVLWGEKDGLIPPVYGPEFQRRIPGARLVTMERTAHMPMLERPEEFVRVVREFLSA
jgi:pimeloyl-ACP methyl ester carboxylesterase